MPSTVLLLAAAWGIGVSPAESGTFTVAETFDSRPFEYRMEFAVHRPGYRVYRLRYPSPVETPFEANNTIPAEYYLPDGIGPDAPRRPAVICLHILGGGFELVELVCSSLASRGIPAIWFKLPYYDERRPKNAEGDPRREPQRFAEALSQGLLDVRRTFDVLAARPEIDPERIGVTGISLGGILAGTAAGADNRFHRAALILAGGDVLEILHHARESRRVSQLLRGLPLDQRQSLEQTLRSVDPLTYAEALRPRAQAGRMLMINAGADEVIPRAATEKLARALGLVDAVVWLDGLGHYTAMAALPQALRTTVAFFAEDLPAGVEPASAGPLAAVTPLGRLVRLVQQAGLILGVGAEPAPGRCHFVDVAATVALPNGKDHEGHVRVVRGAEHRFRIELNIPKFGEAIMAQGEGPWMAGRDNAVFYGELPLGRGPEDPRRFAAEENVLKLRAASGLLGALSFSPETLQRWIQVTEEPDHENGPALRITRKDRPTEHAVLVFDHDGIVPKEATFDVEGVRGRVTFRAWQIDTIAHKTLFEPAADAAIQKVDPDDVYRMFAALLNFAVETIR